MRHPLASSPRHWPEEARAELAEREAILAADRLAPAGAEAIVRASWLAWADWPGSDAHGQGPAPRVALAGS